MEIEGTHGMTFGMRYRNDNLFSAQVNLTNHEDAGFVECLEKEQAELTRDGSSIDISNTCKIYKYYSEETIGVVQSHFTRSLEENLRKSMNSQMVEGEIQPKPKATGRYKRKSKIKTIASSPQLVPPSYVQQLQANAGPVITTAPGSQRFILPRKVENWYTNVEPHYTTSIQHKTDCSLQYNTECIGDNIPGRQSAYSAFCNGKTIVEVYSPTVGRGFNPRFNSLLIEPTMKPYLPAIKGQPQAMTPSQADKEAFMHLAIGFDVPKQ